MPFRVNRSRLDPKISPIRVHRSAGPPATLLLTDRTITAAGFVGFTPGDATGGIGDDGILYTSIGAGWVPVAGQYFIAEPDTGVANFLECKYSITAGVLDATPFDPVGNPFPANQWSYTDFLPGGGALSDFLATWLAGIWGKTANGSATVQFHIRYIPALLPNIYSTVGEEVQCSITLTNT